MSEELDDIGRETAAMMKTMLQIATLVALKTRERGQKEAEARAKLTEAKIKEAREAQVREARESKSKDPRNMELAQMISRPAPEKTLGQEKVMGGQEKVMGLAQQATATVERESMPYRGVSLHKDRPSLPTPSGGSVAAAAAKAAIRYDSPERRAALAAHLAKIGIAPEIAAVRMFMEIGQAKPPIEAIRTRPEPGLEILTGRDQERTRGLERTR
ncbi:hypothetical protein IU485_05145 [Nocardia cyriacigeorgica]|uniref:Uncharacterized protein n=1 Tax=Nocardia cyriacigeorgica (strain GUH-2) TaxID=1127134 RepID=H6R232_NOCCG|nr:hypothetical protein [Nocardia cyriacigeorgica]MBF6080743.1 hypothetical protein [Nocardia cyriacigeorgica]MBF6423576.1 hypothetical protein [Nocardia cyriacigeorgica]CCF64320.1 conserved protein of unknown function [Nocardia cyriacigeorgica GUH-2]BDT87979.1 hypothetical protein FMUAM8_37430 [Nocardia cyriacigeorgica]BDU07390.1 hypothetical protein FMUBM48_36530 [Nocardia cyriacigeorgica]